ncbi:MAG: hypothetical protein M0Z56_04555 [Desulfobacteraceae bacterium]|nr:hypothetical protein [Desulfobacteraceae bacterium]
MGDWSYYPPYVSVAEKKAKAAKKLAQLLKKNPNLQPVRIDGNAITKTWWGRAWNQNLEQYADYSNRIGRGRSYVRNGMVLDLKIQPGKVEALVQGTRSKHYEIAIMINPLDQVTWKKIAHYCEGKLDSLSELLEGKFPKELAEIFTVPGKGLFPAPQEIKFSCSCPDWAHMCKHVAAALYGIGARLDQDAMLFFKLRKVDVNQLIGKAVAEKTKSLLSKAKNKSGRVMENADLGQLFGIELEDQFKPETPRKKAPKMAAGKNSPKKQHKQKKMAALAKPTANPVPQIKKSITLKLSLKTAETGRLSADNKKAKSLTAIDTIEGLIRKSRKGVSLTMLVKKTGFDEKKVYNVLYRLKNLGRIELIGDGKYRSV